MNKKNNYPLQKCLAGEDIKSLSETELLAIILGTGTKDCNVIDLASTVLNNHGGLSGLMQSGIRELALEHGIGMNKALKIHSSIEMGRRVLARPIENNKIDSPEKVWKLLQPVMTGSQREVFMSIILNNKNNLLKKTKISVGTVSETIVHPREVFRDAIRECGSSIIIAHNHPSGDVCPSHEDIVTTNRLIKAGSIIGIQLLDHVIISNDAYYSMKEGGCI